MSDFNKCEASSTGAGRQLTERRKTQNREAQRKYRQKLKNRLENLEREVARQERDRTVSQAAALDIGDSTALPRGATQCEMLGEAIESDQIDLSSINGPGLLSANVSTDLYSLANDQSSMFLSPLEDGAWQSGIMPHIPLGPPPWNETLESLMELPKMGNISNSLISNALPTEWSASEANSRTANDHSQLKIDQVDLYPKPQNENPPPQNQLSSRRWQNTLKPSFNTTEVNGDLGIHLINYLRLNDSKEHQSLIKTAVARGYNVRDVLLAGLGALAKTSTPTVTLSRSLNLVRMSTHHAYYANAQVIKCPVEILHDEDGISLFYQPSSAADPELGLSQYSSICLSLRPTTAQILHPHHPWVDLIPFPSFRQRVLLLIANQPAFDVKQLKHDIFLNDGLTCWRPGGRGSGQPWDMRSWEAEKWFLEKYHFLVAPHCDVVQQTKWWRMMRGELVD